MNFFKISAFKVILLLGLSFSPLFYWPSAPVPFEVPKVYLVNRWIEALVVVGILTNLKTLNREKLDSSLMLLVFTFFITAFVSSFLGVNFEKSILGNYYRVDGLITLSHLVALFLTILVFVKKDWLTDIAISISLGSFLLCLWTIFDAFKFYVLNISSVPNWDGAIGVPFGNPNFLAGYLVVTLPFTLYLTKLFGKRKLLLLLIGAIQIFAILLTKASSGLLGILVFFALVAISKKTRLRKLILATIFACFLMLALAIVTQINDQKVDQLFAAEGRERIIRKGLMAFQEKPITGWGWANFDYAFDSVVWPIRLDQDVYVDKAHSHFLEYLVTTGLVGFVIYIAILGRGLRNLFKAKNLRAPFLFALILFIVHSQTNIISISEEIIFWITMGISGKKIN